MSFCRKQKENTLKMFNMNNFEWGTTLGKFFISIIVIDDFFGMGIRMGKEYAMDEGVNVYHITTQFGFLQFSMGIIGADG